MDGREDVIDGLKGSAAEDELFVTGMLQQMIRNEWMLVFLLTRDGCKIRWSITYVTRCNRGWVVV